MGDPKQIGQLWFICIMDEGERGRLRRKQAIYRWLRKREVQAAGKFLLGNPEAMGHSGVEVSSKQTPAWSLPIQHLGEYVKIPSLEHLLGRKGGESNVLSECFVS